MSSNGRTTVGLFLDSFYGEYGMRIWNGAAKAAEELEISLVSYTDISVSNPELARRSRKGIFNLADPKALDGIIVLPPSGGDDSSKAKYALFLDGFSSLPAIHVAEDRAEVTRVVAENRLGMGLLVDHLIERHGRTRIAFIRGPEGVSDAEARFVAYRASLEAHGIPFRPSLVMHGDFSRDSGAAAAARLVEGAESFDALVGANDYMALYAMKELQRRGIRVPDEVSVAGFDDFLAARSSVPALCTVHQPIEELGEEAVRLIAGLIKSRSAENERRCLPTRLVPRRSCGCISFEGEEAGSSSSEDRLIDAKTRKALIGALEADLGTRFRVKLEEEVVAAYDRGTPVSAWQDIVPGLTRGLPPELRWQAERSINRFLAALQDEIASRSLLSQIEEESVFDQLSGRVLGSFDEGRVREFLDSEFTGRCPFFCLSLFTGDTRHLEESGIKPDL